MTSEQFRQILSRLDQIENTRGTSRAWDIAAKVMIPAVLAIGAWSIRLEVRTSTLEERMAQQPPRWLQNDVAEIKSQLRDVLKRLREHEINNKREK